MRASAEADRSKLATVANATESMIMLMSTRTKTNRLNRRYGAIRLSMGRTYLERNGLPCGGGIC